MPKDEDAEDADLLANVVSPEGVIRQQALDNVRQAFKALRSSTTEEEIVAIWREIVVGKIHDS